MKIYNKEKTEILDNPDLEKGYLIQDKIAISHVPAKEEVKEQYHYEVIKEYENGGKDLKKIIDVPYSPAIEEHDVYEDIQVYIGYTEEELKKIRIRELKQKLFDTDYKAIQYAEGVISEQDYASTKSQRQAWREEIRSLGG